MDRYAQITNGIVSNVIESESDPDGINGEWIACGNAGPGYLYDGEVFTAPPTPLALKHISVGAFFDRFGAHKYPILTSQDPGVQALIKDCSVRKYIDLDNTELPYGLQMLVAAGYAIDAEAVINTPIATGEMP